MRHHTHFDRMFRTRILENSGLYTGSCANGGQLRVSVLTKHRNGSCLFLFLFAVRDGGLLRHQDCPRSREQAQTYLRVLHTHPHPDYGIHMAQSGGVPIVQRHYSGVFRHNPVLDHLQNDHLFCDKDELRVLPFGNHPFPDRHHYYDGLGSAT